MHTVFTLPHVFVVFHPGSAGNFITGLISKIANNDESLLTLNSAGKTHSSTSAFDMKTEGTDYLSLGLSAMPDYLSSVIESPVGFDFSNDQDRLRFYVEKIEEHCININTPQFIWTHDFTNIPLYKQIFPNAKILVVTQESDIEKVTVTFMQVEKTLLDDRNNIPLPDSHWKDVDERLDLIYRWELSKILTNKQLVDVIVNDRNNPVYENVVKYISMKQWLRYFNLLHTVDVTIPKTIDFANNIIHNIDNNLVKSMIDSNSNSPPYKVGKPYSFYVTPDCVKLPYKFLINNDVEMLTNAVASLLDRTLTDADVNLINTNFNEYISKQNIPMLTDPIGYYKNLEQNAMSTLTSLINSR